MVAQREIQRRGAAGGGASERFHLPVDGFAARAGEAEGVDEVPGKQEERRPENPRAIREERAQRLAGAGEVRAGGGQVRRHSGMHGDVGVGKLDELDGWLGRGKRGQRESDGQAERQAETLAGHATH